MKKTLLLFSLILGISSFAQQFEMPAEQYPFYSILEWKGMGAMLMSKDPLGNSKKINLTLAGNATTSIWQQGFNPDDQDFYYIASENARYVYFMDNLQLKEGKTIFHQLNSNLVGQPTRCCPHAIVGRCRAASGRTSLHTAGASSSRQWCSHQGSGCRAASRRACAHLRARLARWQRCASHVAAAPVRPRSGERLGGLPAGAHLILFRKVLGRVGVPTRALPLKRPVAKHKPALPLWRSCLFRPRA